MLWKNNIIVWKKNCIPTCDNSQNQLLIFFNIFRKYCKNKNVKKNNVK
jgi:hypothetical protein